VSRLSERIFGPDWGIRSLDGYSEPGSPENREHLARFVVPIVGGVGFAGFVGWLLIPLTGEHIYHAHIKAMVIVLGIGLFTVAPLFWFARKTSPLWTIHIAGLLTIADLVVLCIFTGPELIQLIGVAFIPVGTVVFVIVRRRIAIAYGVVTAVGYGLILGLRQDSIAPYTMWLDTMAALLLVGIVVAGLVQRTQGLVRRGHDSAIAAQQATAEAERARSEADELARTLEARVTEQVNELERMSKLRRFLSPQVADSVLAADSDMLLEPHRRQIAVFYCDLRGFTRFATGAEPEDTVAILDEYYRTVGVLIRSFDATVGTFAGDGIMAYFNDPVPCEDPAYRAVEMALALQDPMRELIEAWQTDGYDLGYGVGITYGYATLGTIGFESRNDYTAVGSVVNLAARLCAEATTGEILIDGRTNHAVRDRVESEACQLVLKGIPEPVTAYLIRTPDAYRDQVVTGDDQNVITLHERKPSR